MVQVVWFKRDLRTVDHRPLAEAAAAGPVLPLYVIEPDYWALPDTSRRQWIAVCSALSELTGRLAELGAPLVVRTGAVTDWLARIHQAAGITRLLAHQETGNAWTFARDRGVRAFCRRLGIPFVEYQPFGVTRGRGAGYRRAMSSPIAGADACSRLSVPLATGAVSIKEVLQRCREERDRIGDLPPDVRPVPLTAIDSLVSRLHWHCHFIQKLEREPGIEFRSLHPAHERARVATPPDDPVLEAWATGRTGLAFLDACMRSLIATGWLNFRMRAMVQSFASYQLGLDWHASGTRLARLFTDYEPGIHWPQVQMQSGQTGMNTPRIYNPVKQGLDQDPDGVFTQRWAPERLEPIVDLAAATRAARDRLTAIRAEPGYRAASEAVFDRHGSRARRLDDDNIPRRPAKQSAQFSLGL